MNEFAAPTASIAHEISALPTPGRIALALLLSSPGHCVNEAELPKSGYQPYLAISGDQFVVTKSDTKFQHEPSPDPSISDERTEDLCQFSASVLLGALAQITPGRRIVIRTRAVYINRTTINGGWNYASPRLDNTPTTEKEDDTTLVLSLSRGMQRAKLLVTRGFPERPYATVTRRAQVSSIGNVTSPK